MADDRVDVTDNRRIELRVTATHVQWRYFGDEEWLNLKAISEMAAERSSKTRNDDGEATLENTIS